MLWHKAGSVFGFILLVDFILLWSTTCPKPSTHKVSQSWSVNCLSLLSSTCKQVLEWEGDVSGGEGNEPGAIGASYWWLTASIKITARNNWNMIIVVLKEYDLRMLLYLVSLWMILSTFFLTWVVTVFVGIWHCGCISRLATILVNLIMFVKSPRN